VETFDPDLDTAGRPLRAAGLLLMGAGLAYYAYGTAAGLPLARALVALWVFLIVAFFAALLWWMPARLRYALADETLEIRHFLGRRRILLENLREVHEVPFVLGRRSGSAALPGYYVGRFQSSLDRVTAYAGRPAGKGVLLELNTGEKVLLTPRRARLFVARLRKTLPAKPEEA
jgi:hypothetical protein